MGMGSLTRGGAQGPDPQDLEAGALLVPPGHHWSRDDLNLEEAARIFGLLFGLETRGHEAERGFGIFQSSNNSVASHLFLDCS
jgi:hypothetical protein